MTMGRGLKCFSCTTRLLVIFLIFFFKTTNEIEKDKIKYNKMKHFRGGFEKFEAWTSTTR